MHLALLIFRIDGNHSALGRPYASLPSVTIKNPINDIAFLLYKQVIELTAHLVSNGYLSPWISHRQYRNPP